MDEINRERRFTLSCQFVYYNGPEKKSLQNDQKSESTPLQDLITSMKVRFIAELLN